MSAADLSVGASAMPEYTSVISGLAWERKWLPAYRQIIGYYAMRIASPHEDTELSTDMVVLEALGGLKIGCRLRTPGYAHFGDFTITCRRETGSRCEWHKMILGDMADWFFYGHAKVEQPPKVSNIRPWLILNLKIARPWMIENPGPELGPNKDRPGRRCWFFHFAIQQMLNEIGPEVFIARSSSR